MVRPRRVVTLVAKKQVVAIGVRAEGVVGKAEALRPRMLAIVVSVPATDFRVVGQFDLTGKTAILA